MCAWVRASVFVFVRVHSCVLALTVHMDILSFILGAVGTVWMLLVGGWVHQSLVANILGL